MTDTQNRNAHDDEIAALIALLETFGADRARWPTGSEARFAKLIAADPGAQRAVAEAKALDRALDLAPRVAPAREAALLRQIMAQTRDTASVAPSNFVPMHIPQPKQPARAATQGYGLMAAALLLGIIVGAGGLVSPVLDTVAETVGITEDGSELAFVPDLIPSEEDTL